MYELFCVHFETNDHSLVTIRWCSNVLYVVYLDHHFKYFSLCTSYLVKVSSESISQMKKEQRKMIIQLLCAFFATYIIFLFSFICYGSMSDMIFGATEWWKRKLFSVSYKPYRYELTISIAYIRCYLHIKFVCFFFKMSY